MNETVKIIFGLLGGLAVFIYGMNMMSECLQKAAGEKMKAILAMLTKNPVQEYVLPFQSYLQKMGLKQAAS